MRKLLAAAVLVCLTVLLCSCADIAGDEPLFVYGIGADKDGAGYKLYIFASVDELSDAASQKEKPSGGSGAEDAGAAPSFTILTYGGKTVSDAFDAFYKENKEVYSGTNKVYLYGDGMDDRSVREFTLYLMDTPFLPLKRRSEKMDDPYAFFTECTTLSKETYEKKFESGGYVFSPSKQKAESEQ